MTASTIAETVAERQERLARIGYDRDRLETKVDLASLLTAEHYAIERDKVFRRAWLPIGNVDDLKEKGSYFVYEVPTFKASLLVVRGQDDQVRVFHNACRHRGNKLVRSGAGQGHSFRCNFHGWAFSTEGDLRIVTDERMFDGIAKEEYGLVPVHSAVWGKLIFVNFASEPSESLEQWLGTEFFDTYGGYWDLHTKIASYAIEINCNWHLAVNAFTEGSHTLYLHANTVRDYQGGKINPQRHRPHMELTRRHSRYSAPGNPDHKILPVEALAIKYGRKQAPAFDFDYSMLPAGVNPSRYEYWAFDIVQLFPNMVIVAANHARLDLTFWPIDHERTLLINDVYAYKTKNLSERLSQCYFRARGRDVVREDINTLEAQQQVLRSGALSHVLLSRQELALQHHFAVTADMVNAA